MATFSLMVTIAFSYVLVSHANAACSITAPPLSETLASGRNWTTCMYGEVRLDVGSIFTTVSCEHCQCMMAGLQCCGFGYKARAIKTFPGCEIIGDGCDPISVKSCNNGIRCDTGRPLKTKDHLPPL